MMMDKDRVKGSFDQVKGKVKNAIGSAKDKIRETLKE